MKPIKNKPQSDNEVLNFTFDDIAQGHIEVQSDSNAELLGIEEENCNRPWTLISAFDQVLENIHNIGRDTSQWVECTFAAHYLKSQLHLNEIQIMVIAMLIDAGRALSWGNMAKYLGISRLKMMTFTDDVEELVTKHRWLYHKTVREMGSNYEGFALAQGVITAIRKNTPFVPESLDGMTTQTFVDRLVSYTNECNKDHEMQFADEQEWMMELVRQNPHLPLCHEILSLEGDIHTQTLFLLIVADYAQFCNRFNEGVDLSTINNLFPEDWECDMLRSGLMCGNNELMEKGYIDFKCEDGIADETTYVLTEKSKNELLKDYKPYHSTQSLMQGNDKDLINHDSIASKQLFYNETEGQQINRLREIMSQEGLDTIQKRLADKGLRTGVAVLLSGGPGTGKTETVKQLARETGRDLFMIDISEIKSKWVGDSEKNTRAIFERYKTLCKVRKVKPILFINECDAILGKRKENAEHSVDKMQNAMQNILLQALEDLEGIMICTTNLAQSLDSAFERRFLFKVKFDTPTVEVRSRIWKSMIPELTLDDANTLAQRYILSGGQCENVMRKAAIEEILNGTAPSLDILDAFCQEEKTNNISRTLKPIIGFCA